MAKINPSQIPNYELSTTDNQTPTKDSTCIKQTSLINSEKLPFAYFPLSLSLTDFKNTNHNPKP